MKRGNLLNILKTKLIAALLASVVISAHASLFVFSGPFAGGGVISPGGTSLADPQAISGLDVSIASFTLALTFNNNDALASDGSLICLDVDTGKKIWGFNYTEKFGSANPRWGFSEHPLIEGDRLIVAPGGKGAGIVALNKTTGAVIWQAQDDPAHYSSVLPLDFGGVHIYIQLTAQRELSIFVEK